MDDPQADVTADQVLQSTEFNSFAELIVDALGETEPVGVVSGALQPLRSSWMATVGNDQLEGGYTTVTNFSSDTPNYIDGEAARLSGASASSTLQSSEGPQYTIPGDRVGIDDEFVNCRHVWTAFVVRYRHPQRERLADRRRLGARGHVRYCDGRRLRLGRYLGRTDRNRCPDEGYYQSDRQKPPCEHSGRGGHRLT